MCQLLGMNSSKPAALGFSFEGFAERGGRTGEHKDGWGIAFHGSDGCTLLTDQLPSIDSPLAASLKRAPRKATNVVAHIRKATRGRIASENTHPFVRQLWGKTWSFAHNGDLTTALPEQAGQASPPRFVAAGDTDSEQAFCFLLNGLQDRFARQPPADQLYEAIAEMAAAIARCGSFNFLLSNGELLFAHCSTHLHYVVREYPFTVAQLVDCDISINFSQHNHLDDRIAVIATQPLTSNEAWIAFTPGQLTLFVGGEAVARQEPCRHAPRAARPQWRFA
ncbi:MAG: class II glutamine amidotransferase [Pseudomonadota bacterium]